MLVATPPEPPLPGDQGKSCAWCIHRFNIVCRKHARKLDLSLRPTCGEFVSW